ncbi:hypothetical protein [Streptomyces sp. H39-S7]|nr:hypothetical protein [Streptomyces sp. H39-S7]MCZ4122718.1 hypothetical protein [Streptomyces sp. H39-S7]
MSRTRLTRRERLTLVRAATSGLVAGTARSLLTWLLEHFTG